ncbi:MAG TPA: glycosyltransferase [Candidatus Acidoferrales bacterium]|nr:glycosyltransferase [Candidatus Acidoferrales bacterium]
MPIVKDESAMPALSVVVPARDAAATVPRCLDAITSQAAQMPVGVEIIVVDDCSSDATAEIAARYGVRLVKLAHHLGPSAARNRGAEIARAPVLFFLDADVVLAPHALARGAEALTASGADAVMGSYDDDPDARSTVSRFKNLAHHYFHQRARAEAATFWSGCGVVRREVFAASGGFDEEQHSVEDIELGSRMVAQGARIVLDPGLQVKHLKRWTMRSLLATDVLRRAIPWTLLWLEGRRLPDDLNLAADQRIAAIAALALATSVVASPFMPALWLLAGVLVVLGLWLNRDLYRLLLRKGGAWLAINGFLLQQLYYLYSIFGFAAGVAIFGARTFSRRVEAVLRRAGA